MAFDPITTASIDDSLTGSAPGQSPVELDYLRPTGFKFQITNIPNVSFFCQAANLPQMSIGSPMQNTPLTDIPYPGDKLQFGELIIRFLVQEDMANYKELYNWLIGLGSPQDHKQFKDFIKTQQYRFPTNGKQRELAQFSDADLYILDSNNNATQKIHFVDAFPISLSGLDFDISSGDQPYFVGIAAFRYRLFTLETVK